MTDSYTPAPEHKFSFGLWTVSNRGRDPFGAEVRPSLPPPGAPRRSPTCRRPWAADSSASS